ncbi:MAG: hypothetical protein M5U31_10905 [Acidimicrobiia bacterium]|nr:hypothetical protein [Acidimicrobiia bacterium]
MVPIRVRRRSAERGFVALELALGIGLLLLPVSMLVLTFPTWSERQATATVAASDAARRAALSEDTPAARAEAETAVTLIFAGHGLDDTDVDVSWERNGPSRGGTVTAHVTVRMPALAVPGIGDVGAWQWTATHTEQRDAYRSR